MQIKSRRANLAGPSLRSSVARRLIWKLIPGAQLSPRYHDCLLEVVRIIKASHTSIASVRFRSSSQDRAGNQYP
jgi:hypothetical protein